MELLYRDSESTVEAEILSELSPNIPWALINRFSTLVRESGSEGEREAARYIINQLQELGIPYQVYEPELYLSVPVAASIQFGDRRLRAKAMSFSVSTGADGIAGEITYIRATAPEGSSPLGGHIQYASPSGGEIDVEHKIVLLEGYGFEGAAYHFEKLGARGIVYINPGNNIHWGISTTIWGAPDLDNAHRQPQIPIVAINRPDGETLKAQARDHETEVTIFTELKEGWFPCPVIVAEIEGQDEPDRFMLVHGHYDSWAVGVGDNAVGDATLLELARVFHKHRGNLARSVKVAWWPGHSTGRYAGSTWFADTFGLELAKNCIAQLDIDSPGCRWATEYYDISWMKEVEDFCVRAIRDTTGKQATGGRPLQAGDYSFNNIGITGFFLLLSSIPKEVLQEKGYYPVGGCGGNIGWHTEDDTLELADQDNLMRDLQVYAVAVQRIVNATIFPFDFRKVAQEFHVTLQEYANQAATHISFAPVFDALAVLTAELDGFYQEAQKLAARPIRDPHVRALNNAQLGLARILIPINFTRHGRFRTEPAVSIQPLPDLAPALEIGNATGHKQHVIRTHLQRGINRVAWSFESASDVVRTARNNYAANRDER
jgi:N-acetylated-alpha-linked acidic dipeptidase